MDDKINALKEFTLFGSSKKSSSTDSLNTNSVPSSPTSQNGQWGSWFNSKPEDDPYLPSLSRRQRIIGFFMCLLLGVFCFVMAGLIAPFIVLKARKFVMLYTMGSLFTIGRLHSTSGHRPIVVSYISFSLLWGPMNHVKHLCSLGRLPFTAAYFGSMLITLYMALFVKSTILTILFAVIQMISLVWYFVSYIPGGTRGMQFFTRLFSSAVTKTVSSTLPV